MYVPIVTCTSLRMLTTRPPAAGRALIAGFDVATDRDQVRRSIGYVGVARADAGDSAAPVRAAGRAGEQGDVPLAAQAVLIVLIALPLGLDLNVAGTAIGIVLLGVFGIGLGALSYELESAVREQDLLFWVVQQTLMFPLLILSGTMLPLDDAPGWMRALVTINPLGYVVDAERALFAGQLWSGEVLAGVVAAATVAVIGLGVGIKSMR